jgi:hypothetical protein
VTPPRPVPTSCLWLRPVGQLGRLGSLHFDCFRPVRRRLLGRCLSLLHRPTSFRCPISNAYEYPGAAKESPQARDASRPHLGRRCARPMTSSGEGVATSKTGGAIGAEGTRSYRCGDHDDGLRHLSHDLRRDGRRQCGRIARRRPRGSPRLRRGPTLRNRDSARWDCFGLVPSSKSGHASASSASFQLD